MTRFDFAKIDKEHDEDKKFPFGKDEDINEDDLEDDENDEEVETEDMEELEKIESKLERGEEVAISALENLVIAKSDVIFCCPRCKKIFFSKKWVRDIITDLYTVQTHLAYCHKCIGKTYENFIGTIEIYDKNLKERKSQFEEAAKLIERAIESAPPFEKIIDVVEKTGIFFIFTNTTRLAQEIGKFIRQEFGGGVQYEWFEKNQYLRVKWYDEIDNKADFKERLGVLKDRRFGMFSFEEED